MMYIRTHAESRVVAQAMALLGYATTPAELFKTDRYVRTIVRLYARDSDAERIAALESTLLEILRAMRTEH